nr:putative ribonuclease H-like domain-containing protein [Tanacetum cinerariifolium]
MTQEAIKNLIAQRVAEALAEYETQRNSVFNGDTSNTTGTRPRTVRPTRECTYKDNLNYEALKFNGTEGVIGKIERGTKPLCAKCNFYHDGPCRPKCTNCKRTGHIARDCRNQAANLNYNNNNNNGRATVAYQGEKKAKLFNEWERFTSNGGELIESYYNRFLKLINDLKRNKHFPEKIASNLKQMQMVGGNGGNQFRQYTGQNARNPARYNDVIGNQVIQNANQIGNGNLVAARAEGNAAGQNGNQIRCYNCRGVGHYARNYTVRPRRRDAAYLQTQLLIAQKEEAGIQLQAEECDLMVAATDLDEIEEVNANCILMANLQQASTSGAQTDSAPIYDTNGSAEKEEAGIQLQAEECDLMVAAIDLDEIEEVNANCILMANLQQASTSGAQTNSAPIYDTNGSAEGIPQDNIDDKRYWVSGCSRHMTGNISFLSEYEPFNGGYVSFGHERGKITGKGSIKTGKLEFENVYFVEELKYNLFSVLKICDNKNSVMFTDTECLVLGKDFKLVDDKHVLIRTPRQQNMYTIDLKNVVSHKNLTCLIAKASVDESMLLYRRLGHLNFKTINKLVMSNLVKGLPSKSFENDHSCVACLKGKQHKASCKSKLVNSISKPLHTLHMDLFGPTSVSSLNHKWYCFVMADDFSRGEFRNKEMDEFCSRKARTMLADAKLPVTFWAEAVNTAFVVAGTSSINISGTKEDVHQAVKEKESPLRFIALLNWFHKAQMATSNAAAMKDDVILVNNAPQHEQQEVNRDTEVTKSSGNSNPTAITSSVPRIISRGGSSFPKPPSLGNAMSFENRFEDFFRDTSNAVSLNKVEVDLSNMETAIQVSPTPTLRIHNDHPKSQIIGLVDTPIQTRQKTKNVDEQSFIATIHQKTNTVLLKYCLFSCFLSQEEPKKIVDALKDPSWVEAMQQELLQFKI